MPEFSTQPQSIRRRQTLGAALPLLTSPIDEQDVLRAALLWNLTVALAREGARAILLAPATSKSEMLWPEPGRGPFGAELVLVPCEGPSDFARTAVDLAVAQAENALDGGFILVSLPPAWLDHAEEVERLLRWTLLFSGPEPYAGGKTLMLTQRVLAACPASRVGVTLLGVGSISEARAAFLELAQASETKLGHPLTSYGLLVDDLEFCRSVVSRRAVGLVRPRSPSVRALGDVASLLLADAQELAPA